MKYWLWIIIVGLIILGVAGTALMIIIFGKSKPQNLPQDCLVEWQPWSACDPICGQTGTQQRSYKIIKPSLNGGKACPPFPESQSCFGGPCPNQASLQGNALSFGLPLALKSYQDGVSDCATWGYTIGFWIKLPSYQPMQLANLVGMQTNAWSFATKTSSTISSFGGQWPNGDIRNVDFSKPICIMLSGHCSKFEGVPPYVAHYISVNNSNAQTTGGNYPTWPDTGYQPMVFFGGSNGITGQIQEFRQWNKNLTLDEAASFYNQGVITKKMVAPSNTVVTFHLDEGVGNQVLEMISGQHYPVSGNFSWANPVA